MKNLIQQQQAFGDLVATILARFASSVASDLDKHIQESLGEIARFVCIEYAYLVHTSPDHSMWSVTHEWCAPGSPSLLSKYQNVPMGTFHWAEQVLLAGGMLLLNSLDDVPSEHSDTRAQIEATGFKSSLQLPLYGEDGRVNGCIALSALQGEVKWSDADIQRLRLVGNSIANALRRKRAEEELRMSERRYRTTFEQAPIGILNLSSDGCIMQANERFCNLLGYRLEELLGHSCCELTHADDRDACKMMFDELLNARVPCEALEKRYVRKNGRMIWVKESLSLLAIDMAKTEAGYLGMDQPCTVIATVEDVTDRKQAEAELRGALKEVDRLSDQLRAENVYLQEELASSQGFDEIVGESVPLRITLSKIEHVADTDASVLLLGETGTGKELLARAIHNRSSRKERPLVKVNLAALPASLIESELFGHVRGAFTGAIADKIGRFELADGGTLFLDEIGELNPELQTKLLRVLQEGEFERIGSGKTLRVDVRVVAATNRNLQQAMGENKFRPDLYYRLAVFPIEAPPLRLRREDIPLLVWHFISKKQVRLGKAITSVPASVMNTLVEYDWPGNVRELENVVERAMILSSGSTLVLEGFSRPTWPSVPKPQSASPPAIERERIVGVLNECRWKIKGAGNAAERLGLKPSTLRYRMKVLQIERPLA
jgi:formate hydrogenlyase transcriptional activator